LSIVGIGTDIVAIARLRRLVDEYGERLVTRLLAPDECAAYRTFCDAPPAAAFLARRFAAKEAAAKALGCGIGAEARFTELAVGHTDQGAPQLCLTGAARRRADHLGVTRLHLSISDERDQALAFVLLER
jgi:holo-[acyl-carrier protein] synthase